MMKLLSYGCKLYRHKLCKYMNYPMLDKTNDYPLSCIYNNLCLDFV